MKLAGKGLVAASRTRGVSDPRQAGCNVATVQHSPSGCWMTFQHRVCFALSSAMSRSTYAAPRTRMTRREPIWPAQQPAGTQPRTSHKCSLSLDSTHPLLALAAARSRPCGRLSRAPAHATREQAPQTGQGWQQVHTQAPTLPNCDTTSHTAPIGACMTPVISTSAGRSLGPPLMRPLG